jgi:outer membrane protein OmpA-like peptidoglycan-associated protein
MKKNFGKLGAVCFFVIAASSLGCSSGAYRADRDEYNQYNATQAQRDAYRGDDGRRYQVSPPPELVAAGVVDPSGLHSTSTEGLRRTTDLVSPPPELTSAGVVDRSGLNSGSYNTSTSTYNSGYTATDRDLAADRDMATDRDATTGAALGTAAGTAAATRDTRDDRTLGEKIVPGDRRIAADKIARNTVISFEAGNADLSDAEKAKLHEIVASIGADNIRRVEVAAWSDKAFPRSGNDLPKGDRDLADKRADNINDYLKKEDDLSFMRIRTYSMAETSNWLARMFRTDEAELKSVFSRENEAPMAREDFNVILNEGGPSKAVVVFIRK